MNFRIVVISLLGLLSGCTTYSYIETSNKDQDIKAILPKVSIVSPSQYDYYPYIFRDLNFFEEISEGYTNSGLEIRVQRGSSPKNQVLTFASLMLSASTLFVVPSVGQFEETLSFSVYKNGEKINSYSYATTKYMTLWLFNPPNSQDDGAISRKIDLGLSKQFINDFSKDYKIFSSK